jgi:hypothetical protein
MASEAPRGAAEGRLPASYGSHCMAHPGAPGGSSHAGHGPHRVGRQ